MKHRNSYSSYIRFGTIVLTIINGIFYLVRASFNISAQVAMRYIYYCEYLYYRYGASSDLSRNRS